MSNIKNALDKIVDNLSDVITPTNVRLYLLGTKKSGQPRALYDIYKDIKFNKKKKKKKKKNNDDNNSFALYLKTKKKKKKKDKYWHI